MLTPARPPTAATLSVKDRVGIIKDVLTIVVVLTGSIWFLVERDAYSQASIDLQAIHHQLTDDWTWVQVQVQVTNVGKRLLRLEYATIKLQKVLPLDTADQETLDAGISLLGAGEHHVQWPRIGPAYRPDIKLHIEPGESHTKTFDFIIPARVETVRLYAYFAPDELRERGWTKSLIYDLTDRPEEPTDDTP